MTYFRNSFLVTAIGLALGAYLGWEATHSWTGALSTTFIVGVLAILEVSLSFDNAVVNACVLKKMTPVWRRRFITWGIAIAVFGMRIVFPLAIVAIIARIGPVSALVMAATDPESYSRVLTSANVSVSAFGGAFLAMVGPGIFNRDKCVHWIAVIERPYASRAHRGGGTRLVLLYVFHFTRLSGHQFVPRRGDLRARHLYRGRWCLGTVEVESAVSGRWCSPARRRFSISSARRQL
jgi:hypothetical protein